MISDGELRQMIREGERLGYSTIVEALVELEAYRKAFSEPCGFINPVYFNDGMMGCTLHRRMRHNMLEPLYRKPTIPE